MSQTVKILFSNCQPLGDRLCCLPRRFPPTYGKYASSRRFPPTYEKVRLRSVNRKSSSSAPRLSSKGLAVIGGRVVTLFLSLFFVGCVSKGPSYSPVVDSISVMTFNVENLFDTLDEPGKNDETYMPLSQKTPRVLAKCSGLARDHWRQSCRDTNWTEKILDRKMKRIADVIKQVKSGRGPEVLILPEVENKPVVESLRRRYLADFGYGESVLIEGPDSRGIDVAILTKLKVVAIQSHRVNLEIKDGLTEGDIISTRDIIQADLQLPDGQVLTVLGVHFPSQASPIGTRIQAIRHLNEIKTSLPKNRLVVAGGDFNITSREEGSHQLYKEKLGSEWAVSHELGCEDCKGTYYYHSDTSWSFLDAILFSKDMLPEAQGRWKVVTQSIRVPTESLYQINRYGSPAKYRGGKAKTGVSDHWPMVAEIIPRRQKGETQ